MKVSFLLLCVLMVTDIAAQIDIPPDFSLLLDRLDVRLTLPPDGDYREAARHDNDYLADQFAINSRREKTEIRLYVQPEEEDDQYYRRPHLAATTLAMNLGSNDEDAITAVHSFDDEELQLYGADWAKMYTFRPKRGFSSRQQAQLIALYQAGRGMVYTILLFDEAPLGLEERQLILRFR